MDYSIKPKPLIGEILPGFTFLALALYSYFTAHPCQFEWIISKGGATTIAASGLVLIISWIIGSFFDALREILEKVFDHWQSIHWDFFFESEREKVEQLDNYYYSYYKLDVNFVIGIVIFLIAKFSLLFFDLGFMGSLPYKTYVILVFAIIVFSVDAMILRKEIKENIDKEKAQTK